MAGVGCLIRPITGTARAAGTIFTEAYGITIRRGMFTSMAVDTTGTEASGLIFLLPIGIRRVAVTSMTGYAGMCMDRVFTLTGMAAAIFITKAHGICTRGDTTRDIVETDSFSFLI